jgi:putative membrane protein
MLNIKTFRLTGVALIFVAGAAGAQTGLNDLEIAHAAYTADTIDIDYAKIALSKTKNPEIRHFAELMIRDHTAVNKGAGDLLSKLHVQPKDNAFSQTLISGATAKKAELQALDGAAFDRAYALNEQAYHHQVNTILSETWLPTVQNADLKAFLTQGLATFRVHEEHANHMVSALK